MVRWKEREKEIKMKSNINFIAFVFATADAAFVVQQKDIIFQYTHKSDESEGMYPEEYKKKENRFMYRKVINKTIFSSKRKS